MHSAVLSLLSIELVLQLFAVLTHQAWSPLPYTELFRTCAKATRVMFLQRLLTGPTMLRRHKSGVAGAMRYSTYKQLYESRYVEIRRSFLRLGDTLRRKNNYVDVVESKQNDSRKDLDVYYVIEPFVFTSLRRNRQIVVEATRCVTTRTKLCSCRCVEIHRRLRDIYRCKNNCLYVAKSK
jgi:hypothetical protein